MTNNTRIASHSVTQDGAALKIEATLVRACGNQNETIVYSGSVAGRLADVEGLAFEFKYSEQNDKIEAFCFGSAIAQLEAPSGVALHGPPKPVAVEPVAVVELEQESPIQCSRFACKAHYLPSKAGTHACHGHTGSKLVLGPGRYDRRCVWTCCGKTIFPGPYPPCTIAKQHVAAK